MSPRPFGLPRRDSIIEFEITPEEEADWTARAAAEGLTLETWVRVVLNEGVEAARAARGETRPPQKPGFRR